MRNNRAVILLEDLAAKQANSKLEQNKEVWELRTEDKQPPMK